MLLFLCDYAIFYAPIMPLYAHIYAPNYADYAQIIQIMLKLCLIMSIMPKYAVYAKLCNYAKLCPPSHGDARGDSIERLVSQGLMPGVKKERSSEGGVSKGEAV